MKSRKYEFRKPDNQYLGEVYGYTPDEAAEAYFSTHGAKPTSVTENEEGTFDVFVNGRIFKMIPKEAVN